MRTYWLDLPLGDWVSETIQLVFAVQSRGWISLRARSNNKLAFFCKKKKKKKNTGERVFFFFFFLQKINGFI